MSGDMPSCLLAGMSSSKVSLWLRAKNLHSGEAGVDASFTKIDEMLFSAADTAMCTCSPTQWKTEDSNLCIFFCTSSQLQWIRADSTKRSGDPNKCDGIQNEIVEIVELVTIMREEKTPNADDV